jgi:Domain of unknown function (DUF397)
VEIAVTADKIAIRNSKDPDGPILVYTPGEFEAFLDRTRKGSSGLLTGSENQCEISGLEEPKTRLLCHVSPVHRLEGIAALHNYLASIFTAFGRPGRKRFQ